ncbi:hypothetical protein BH09MYX1_BH09MYX1_67610 [soil metagenome]
MTALAARAAVGLPLAKRALRELAKLASDLSRGFFETGLALARFRDARFALFLGHRSFGAFLRSNALLRRATAYKLLSIATHLPPKRAMTLGMERAYALSRIVVQNPKAATDRAYDGSIAHAGRWLVAIEPRDADAVTT